MLPKLRDHQAEFVCTHGPILAFRRGLHESDLLAPNPRSSLLGMILFERLELSFGGRAPRLFLKTVPDTTKTYCSLADHGALCQGPVGDCMAPTTLEFPIRIDAYQLGTIVLESDSPLTAFSSASSCLSARCRKTRRTSGSKILSPCCWRLGDA